MHSLPIETKRERKNSIAIVHWRSLATRGISRSGLRNFRGIPFLQLVTRRMWYIAIMHWRSLATRGSTIIETMIDFELIFEEWT
ncbi:hypothetical protein V1478_000012 [Vespula squamosa]|uniref:Uncharacterized protein n=1 Tax=Vespula squamosa TaxID=30214 RepID=A0ABD2BW05_VESSQ